jgi:hypothetical protein
MRKLTFFASIATIVASLGLATLTSTDAQAVTPCVTKQFKTKLAQESCAKGGQPEAKAAMKKFMKAAKIKSCNQCHSKLAPKYELKADGVEQFEKAGGELLTK